jgi:hypothetical protein
MERKGEKFHTICVCPDSRHALTISGSAIFLWDLDQGRLVRRIQEDNQQVNCLAHLPEPGRALVGRTYGLSLLDLAQGQMIRYPGFIGTPYCMAITPDGRRAFLGGDTSRGKGQQPMDRGIVRVWDVAAGREQSRCEELPDGINRLCLSANGRRLLLSSGVEAHIWEPDAGPKTRLLKAGDYPIVEALALSPDGRLALVSCLQTVWLLDVAADREVGRLESPGMVRSVAFSPNGRLALVGGSATVPRPGQGPNGNGLVQVWDVATRQELTQLTGHQGEVMALCFLPDGQRALSAGLDGTLRLWDLSSLPDPGPAPMQPNQAQGLKKTGIDAVYAAFQLRNLRPKGGPHRVGETVQIEGELASMSDEVLTVPPDPRNGIFQIGITKSWIEKVDGDSLIPPLAERQRQGRRYALRTSSFQGRSVPARFQFPTRANVVTTGYPPGRYRFTLEFCQNDGKVLQTSHVDFELQPAP